MSILKFLGTTDVTDEDDYGTIQMKLALDLVMAVKNRSEERVIEAKARNIIKVCCEPMFDTLIGVYEWCSDETEYADDVISNCIESATFELLEIVNRRVTHKQKWERWTGLRIEDLKIAAIMAFVLNAPKSVRDQLEDTFVEDHGGMYFDSGPS